MWSYILLNIISMICWTILAVRFDMWWIALFRSTVYVYSKTSNS